MVKNEKINAISLDGGALCLDFVNTVHDRTSNPPSDYFQDIGDLMAWSVRVRLIESTATEVLFEEAQGGYEILPGVIRMRELLYRMFYTICRNKIVGIEDMTLFNEYSKEILPLIRIQLENGNYREGWDIPTGSIKHITAPILKDARELLLSDRLMRVKECPNCGWLFLDTTRNGKRRWCSMKNCGSNVKALNWYYRQKKVDK